MVRADGRGARPATLSEAPREIDDRVAHEVRTLLREPMSAAGHDDLALELGDEAGHCIDD